MGYNETHDWGNADLKRIHDLLTRSGGLAMWIAIPLLLLAKCLYYQFSTGLNGSPSLSGTTG